jgi:hypothetical protein
MKTLFPNSSVSSNANIPSENIELQKEDRLGRYEFDVSFQYTLRC